MLKLQQISLTQFKNYDSRSFLFNERIIGICGPNGAGKTNLLDAIHYICFTRSYFNRNDSVHVMHGRAGFRVEGDFMLNEKPEKAVCILRETGRKEFRVNETIYKRFSEHIGRYPCVVIAPDDAVLVTGGSEERRNFMDALFSQLDSAYLQHLITYQKVLQQRNALLKSFAETGLSNEELLNVLDEQLAEPGDYIFRKRISFLEKLLPLVKEHCLSISGKPENVHLHFESELLSSGMTELLKASRQKDLHTLRTCSGIHKDELEITLNGQPFRQTASQGQRKSLLFALKLAELDMLESEKGFAPLLLLDDVFEKLDEDRIQKLLHRVCKENTGQVFITDTHVSRLKDHLQKAGTAFQVITL